MTEHIYLSISEDGKQQIYYKPSDDMYAHICIIDGEQSIYIEQKDFGRFFDIVDAIRLSLRNSNGLAPAQPGE